jgi:hypothetical protein
MRQAHASTAIFSFVGGAAAAFNVAMRGALRRAAERRTTMRTETVTTIDLGYEQMFVFDGGRDGRVRVLYGAAWLTEEGRAADAIARAGEELPLHGGLALLEALAPSRLQIIDAGGRGPARRGADWLRRLARGGRRLFARQQLGAPAAEANG